MHKVFTCEACECSYSMREGEPWPTECDRCGHLVGFVKDAPLIPEGVVIKFIKHDDDKPEWDLLPMEVMEQVVKVLMHGAKKYEPFNWQKGTEYKRYYNAAMRHLIAWQQNENLDPDSGLHHLDHAMCCLVFLRYFELFPDDYSKFDNRLEGRIDKHGEDKIQSTDEKISRINCGDDSLPEMQDASGSEMGTGF